jgi:Family of unknown function (DUF5808)
MKNGNGKARSSARWVGRAVGVVLLGSALISELRKPAGTRTWEGSIAGKIPYDLRRPTRARIRQRLWNPADRRLLVPTVFGVGWTINLGRLLKPWVAEQP